MSWFRGASAASVPNAFMVDLSIFVFLDLLEFRYNPIPTSLLLARIYFKSVSQCLGVFLFCTLINSNIMIIKYIMLLSGSDIREDSLRQSPIVVFVVVTA